MCGLVRLKYIDCTDIVYHTILYLCFCLAHVCIMTSGWNVHDKVWVCLGGICCCNINTVQTLVLGLQFTFSVSLPYKTC